MTKSFLSSLLRVVLVFSVVLGLIPASFDAAAGGAGGGNTAAASKPSDAVLDAMRQELSRATKELAKAENPPYFIGYSVYDQDLVVIVGSYGSLLTSASAHRREADVTMRVGSPALDNTHGDNRQSGMTSGPLPVNDDRDAIARVLWELTDREYKRAAPTYLNVKTNSVVRAEEEDKSPDFSKEAAQNHAGATPRPLQVDREVWEQKIRNYSRAFRRYPEVYSSMAILQVDSTTSRFASSEGSALTMPSASARLVIQAETRAEDGMELLRVETFQAPSAKELPPDAEINAKIEEMAADLKALRAAPVAEPYNGPAILSGRASALFFHEVLGHRLEGHRQRSEDEGQTFTKKVGQAILPDFLSIADDPTAGELAGVKLAGSYAYVDMGGVSRGACPRAAREI